MKQHSKEQRKNQPTAQSGYPSPCQVPKLVWVGQHPRAPLLVYTEATKG